MLLLCAYAAGGGEVLEIFDFALEFDKVLFHIKTFVVANLCQAFWPTVLKAFPPSFSTVGKTEFV